MQSFLEASLPGDSFIQWVDTAVNMAAASIMLGLVVALVTQAFLDLFGRRQVLRAVTRKWIARCHKEGLELATSVGAMSDLGHREHADAESEPLRVDSSVFHLGPEQVAAKYDVVFRNGIENPDFPADLILGVIASGHSQIAPRRVAEALMAVRHPEKHDAEQVQGAYQLLSDAVEVAVDEFQAFLANRWMRNQYIVSLIVAFVVVTFLYVGPTDITVNMSGWLVGVFLAIIAGLVAFSMRLVFARMFKGMTA
ncbi:hypothetical protein NHF40_03395 [Maricaulaceae bacterium EIL42A08]|nr:hypothetical protein [Maricaulaceae bacterium EIL42A08]